MKRAISIALVLMLAASFTVMSAGCNRPKDNSGEIKIYVTNPVSERQQKQFDYFTEMYQGTVNAELTPWNGWPEKFATDFQAGNAPDAVLLIDQMWPRIAMQKMLVSIEDMQANGVTGFDDELFQTPNTQSSRNVFKYAGKTYAVSGSGNEPIMLWVNMDIFKRFSVKSPGEYYKEGNWNWANFEKCIKEVTKDVDSNGSTDIWGYGAWDMSYITRAFDAPFVKTNDDGSLKLVMNDSSGNMMAALTAINRIWMQDKAAPSNTNTWLDYFLAGQNATMACPSGNVLRQLVNNADFEWDVVPFPLGPNNKSGMYPGLISGMGVTSSSKKQQLAVDYLRSNRDYDLKFPTTSAWDSLTVAQQDMINGCLKNAVNSGYQGVADMWGQQWGFWWDIKTGYSPAEVMSKYEPVFNNQVQIAMRDAKSDQMPDPIVDWE